MSNPETESTATGGGLLGSVRALLCTLIALSKTRLEIFVTELEEERLRITQQAILIMVGCFCSMVGVLLLLAFVVVLLWDTHRLLTLGLLTLAFLGAGASLFLVVNTRARSKPKAFSASLGELTKDLDQLSGKP
jgi:uncharacterized membrane protein YqjE